MVLLGTSVPPTPRVMENYRVTFIGLGLLEYLVLWPQLCSLSIKVLQCQFVDS